MRPGFVCWLYSEVSASCLDSPSVLSTIACVVVARGWAGLLGCGGSLHQCSCISGSCVVAITGREVGKGGEFLVQVLTQGVEFTLDGSGGGLLLGCRMRRRSWKLGVVEGCEVFPCVV